MFNAGYSKSAVLSLNAILLDSPRALVEHFADEVPGFIAAGIKHKTVRLWAIHSME